MESRANRRIRQVDEEWSEEADEFQDRHRSFSDRVERFVMQLVILGLVGLVLVQTLHLFPTFRRVASLVDGLEGVPWEEMTRTLAADRPVTPAESPAAPANAILESYEMTVLLVSQPSAPGARLLVDGKAAGSFAEPALQITVRPGQSLAVDGSQVKGKLTFRVVGASGLANPRLGTTVTTDRNRQSLGIVQSTR